uniref:CCHC-type domain-containing protein n=1 Tax=Tanacetum cinerariifolium TaxID=118510 RepID=A0A699HVN0_TANCI|nr:hypothetical protein [Tanacetum cinerariifolium]
MVGIKTMIPSITTSNVTVNNDRRGCTYKEFLACNLKEYDGKEGAIVYTHWIEKMSQSIHEVKKPLLEWVTKKNPKKRGNKREPNKDRNARDENNKTRTGNAFATTTNPVRREYNGLIPKCVSYNLHHLPEIPCRACFNCGRPGHMAKDYRVALGMVNPVNARNPAAALGACYECGETDHFKAACPKLNQAQRPRGNRQNQVVANNGGQGHGNNNNQACGRAFMLGAEEAH